MSARYRIEISPKAPHGVKKLMGPEGRYRIRVGDYRVIYTIADDVLDVVVVEVVNRRDAYR